MNLLFRAFFTNSSLLKQKRGSAKTVRYILRVISHILPPGACQRAITIKEDAVGPNSHRIETKNIFETLTYKTGEGAPDVTVSVDID